MYCQRTADAMLPGEPHGVSHKVVGHVWGCGSVQPLEQWMRAVLDRHDHVYAGCGTGVRELLDAAQCERTARRTPCANPANGSWRRVSALPCQVLRAVIPIELAEIPFLHSSVDRPLDAITYWLCQILTGRPSNRPDAVKAFGVVE